MKTKEYLNFLLDDYNSSNYLQEAEDGLQTIYIH
ncbi:unknown [Clostridium sp. CAG:269]|nr:unknown [Clostridium sp. CAG:269]